MRVNETTIRVEKGDLTLSEVDAIVFYATGDLKLGTGFGNAIAMRGGPSIQDELNDIGQLAPLKAVLSSAGDLPAKQIVHVNGPRFQEQNLAEKLRTALGNALTVAEAAGLRTIAFPPMGAGFYGIPLEVCAEIMVSTFIRHATSGSSIREIRIVVMNNRELRPFAERLDQEKEGVAA